MGGAAADRIRQQQRSRLGVECPQAPGRRQFVEEPGLGIVDDAAGLQFPQRGLRHLERTAFKQVRGRPVHFCGAREVGHGIRLDADAGDPVRARIRRSSCPFRKRDRAPPARVLSRIGRGRCEPDAADRQHEPIPIMGRAILGASRLASGAILPAATARGLFKVARLSGIWTQAD